MMNFGKEISISQEMTCWSGVIGSQQAQISNFAKKNRLIKIKSLSMVTAAPTNRSSLMVAAESPIVSLLRIVMAQVPTVKPWLMSAQASTVRHWLMVGAYRRLIGNGSAGWFTISFTSISNLVYQLLVCSLQRPFPVSILNADPRIQAQQLVKFSHKVTHRKRVWTSAQLQVIESCFLLLTLPSLVIAPTM